MRIPRVLDLGCGPNKISGAIGVDHRPFPGVDAVWDLDRVPYPFADAAVDEVIFRHSLEHLTDPLGAVKEAARVLRDGGRLRIDTPHFSSMNAYADMTHRHAFAFHAFRALATGQEATGGRDMTHFYEEVLAGLIQRAALLWEIGVVKRGLRSLLDLLEAPVHSREQADAPAALAARDLGLFATASDSGAPAPSSTRRAAAKEPKEESTKSASPRRKRSA